jgi:hypothetical protein
VKLPDAPAPAPGPVSHAAADLPPPSALAPSRIGVEPPQGQVSTRAPELSAIARPRPPATATTASLRIAPGRSTPAVTISRAPAPRIATAVDATDDEAEEAFLAKVNLRFADGPQLSRETLSICHRHLGTRRSCAACPVRRECDAATRVSDALLPAMVFKLNAASAHAADAQIVPSAPSEPVAPDDIAPRSKECRGCGGTITVHHRGRLPTFCGDCKRNRNRLTPAGRRALDAARDDSEPPPPPPTSSADAISADPELATG